MHIYCMSDGCYLSVIQKIFHNDKMMSSASPKMLTVACTHTSSFHKVLKWKLLAKPELTCLKANFPLIWVLGSAQQLKMWENSISIAVESHNSVLSCTTALRYKNPLECSGIQQNLIRTMKVVHKSWRHTLKTRGHTKHVVEFHIIFKVHSISEWDWKKKLLPLFHELGFHTAVE